MSIEQKKGVSETTEGARRATGEVSETKPRGPRGRWSAKRKVSVVLELLRGEDLETLSRRHGVTAATLSGWRDAFLASGEAGLKAHEDDSGNEETRRLKSVVADLHMDCELLREKIKQLEANRPLGWRRWKP
jgi:transposase-like protein